MKYTPEQLKEMAVCFKRGEGLWAIAKQFGGYANSVKRALYKTYPNISVERDTYTKQLFYRLVKTWGAVYGERTAEFVVAEFLRRFDQKRQNVVGKSSHEFSITPEDITPVKFCPYTNLELNWEGFGKEEDNVSFDRIDNSKGYVVGNVLLCSWRGNRLKNNGTAEEHRRVYEVMSQAGCR